MHEITAVARYPVDGFDNIGARLTIDDKQDGWFSVGETAGSDILYGIGYRSDIIQTHSTAILVGDDQRSIGVGFQQLVGSTERPGMIHPPSALGTVGIGTAKHRTEIFQAQSLVIQNRRIGIDPDRW